jgi:lipopolysaccharide transport system permease protein
MTVFTVVFSLFARLPSDGVPYALFSYCAILPWQFFSGVLGRGVGSLLGNQALVKKVYFPREIILFSVVASATVDFAIGAAIFFGLLWFYPVSLSMLTLLLVPVFAIQVVFVIGLILILSPINVFYRDVGLAIPLLLQIWMFATPIIYPVSMVPERLRVLYSVNPMVGVIDAYRQLILHGKLPDATSLIIASVIACITFVAGLLYFKRVEFKLADVI